MLVSSKYIHPLFFVLAAASIIYHWCRNLDQEQEPCGQKAQCDGRARPWAQALLWTLPVHHLGWVVQEPYSVGAAPCPSKYAASCLRCSRCIQLSDFQSGAASCPARSEQTALALESGSQCGKLQAAAWQDSWERTQAGNLGLDKLCLEDETLFCFIQCTLTFAAFSM